MTVSEHEGKRFIGAAENAVRFFVATLDSSAATG
jgi:hypothetical protein